MGGPSIEMKVIDPVCIELPSRLETLYEHFHPVYSLTFIPRVGGLSVEMQDIDPVCI